MLQTVVGNSCGIEVQVSVTGLRELVHPLLDDLIMNALRRKAEDVVVDLAAFTDKSTRIVHLDWRQGG